MKVKRGNAEKGNESSYHENISAGNSCRTLSIFIFGAWIWDRSITVL